MHDDDTFAGAACRRVTGLPLCVGSTWHSSPAMVLSCGGSSGLVRTRAKVCSMLTMAPWPFLFQSFVGVVRPREGNKQNKSIMRSRFIVQVFCSNLRIVSDVLLESHKVGSSVWWVAVVASKPLSLSRVVMLVLRLRVPLKDQRRTSRLLLLFPVRVR
ncbi:expressed unknown protein [Seminavis robusta]|uniref:Uncharacterized protein n=1 Tax=Seminavis robusta TaxID=568900 RepID=A0A9N8DRP7_9STRA|nr:expressed unknown protein [Seminavis robusta]|eukprot:Sro304_g112560.1 n/a (158) ;mRNA; r:22016-23067